MLYRRMFCYHFTHCQCRFIILFCFLLNVSLIYCQTSLPDKQLITTIIPDNLSVTTEEFFNSTESNLVGVDNDPCTDLDVSAAELDGVLCRTHADCQVFNQFCCELREKKICVRPPVKINPATHQPLLGVLPRECPDEPIPEPFAVKKCLTDNDCWPRICCPDGNDSYCRTPQPPWQKLRGQRLVGSLRNMMAYMQCTPPPPPLYDLFPKECRSTLDCFPNLCCQEQNKKVCRPPRKSLLALISSLGGPR